jgi:hypothetical protein
MEIGNNISSRVALGIVSGNGQIEIGNLNVTIAHGGSNLKWVAITPQNPGGVDLYLETLSATNIKVSMEVTQPDITYFFWTAGE